MKLPALVKILSVKNLRGMIGTVQLSQSGMQPEINLNEVYFRFTDIIQVYNHESLLATVYDLKTNEVMFGGETTSIIINVIEKWEYHNTVDLTKVNISELDEDSLIPDDLYKITV
jgi:hypothetical protein